MGDPAYPPGTAWTPGGGGGGGGGGWDRSAPTDSANYGPPQGAQTFQGYGQPSFDNFSPLPPPPPPPPPPASEAPKQDFEKLPNLSPDDCKEAIQQWVAQHCCYGKKPARDLVVNQTSAFNALHYQLETFCEGRSTKYAQEPYRGGPVDGPENGHPPGPWQIPCQPSRLFADEDKHIEVPHTAHVIPCHRCSARGWLRCGTCGGDGRTRCDTCGGDGRRQEYNPHTQQHEVRRCNMCGGDGQRRCNRCGGDGRITCPTCRGFRMMKTFIKLTVTYKNHLQDFIEERTDMPDHLIREVSGKKIFEQQMLHCWPIIGFPVPAVNQNSIRLIESHKTAFGNENRLMQRHWLRCVPVTEVAWSWDDKSSRFWVYGNEREVHCPDYPQTCCWGCNIL